jgi:hypothetical protein
MEKVRVLFRDRCKRTGYARNSVKNSWYKRAGQRLGRRNVLKQKGGKVKNF